MADKPDMISRADAIAAINKASEADLCGCSHCCYGCNTAIHTIRALPAAQVAVKPLDLSNIQKHAFLSGVVAARNIPGYDECDGPSLWVDYDPGENPALVRIRSAMIPTPALDPAQIRADALREASALVYSKVSTFPDNVAWCVEDLAKAILTMIPTPPAVSDDVTALVYVIKDLIDHYSDELSSPIIEARATLARLGGVK